MPVSQEVAARAGAKRKRNAASRYYSVRVGRKPGIYHSWDECHTQVQRYKGSKYQSFSTLTEAEKFLNGDEGSATVPGNKFYAVKSGRAPGIYTDWPNVQKQITGWTKPDFRLFTTYAEALRFMGTESADPSTLPPGVTSDGTMLDQVLEAGHAVKKQKGERVSADTNALKVQRMVSDDRVRDGYEPGVQLPPGAEDGFDTNIILKKGTGEVVFKSNDQREATKPRSTGKTSGCMLRIYTDGSSLRNGQKGAFAGVGVYFGPLDSRNISESLPGPRQTNQRAELTAIVRALDTAPKDRDVTIVTDSQYAINCATKWYVSWRKNEWKTASGKSVENRDIVENIVSKVEERRALQSETDFEWIKGHANHEGNIEADKLAVDGARQAAQLP